MVEALELMESDEGKKTGEGQLEIEELRWEIVSRLGALKREIWVKEWDRLKERIEGAQSPP